MIKVLYLPLNFGDVVQSGVYQAFRQPGVELQLFDYLYEKHHKRQSVSQIRAAFYNKAIQYKPDLIHMQLQHLDIIDARTVVNIKKQLPKTIITNWTGDVRTYVPPTYKEIGKVVDYNLISSTGQLELFRKHIGQNVYYWQIGFDPTYYCPSDKPRSNFDWDVIFIGNNDLKENYPGRKEREAACHKLRSAFGQRFRLYGSNWPRNIRSHGSVNQKKVGEMYHRSFCLLSISHFNDISHYFSDRLLMCLASGRPTISLAFPKWESYFTNNCDLCIVNSVDEIVPKVKYLLNNRDYAEYIGKSGCQKAFAEHTYTSRVNELFKIVGLR